MGILLNVLSTKAIKFKMLITNTSYSKGPGHCPLGHFMINFVPLGPQALEAMCMCKALQTFHKCIWMAPYTNNVSLNRGDTLDLQESVRCLLLLSPHDLIMFKLMITFTLCFSVGNIPEMQGWTQLSPHPRPLIGECPHPWALPYTIV